MAKYFIKLLFASLLVLAISSSPSCNDLPADIDLITDSLDIKSVSSEQRQIITGTRTIKTEFNSRFQSIFQPIGKANGVSSYPFIRYSESSMPDTLFDDINESKIDSAFLYLFPSRYAQGDFDSRSLDFDIYDIIEPIDTDTRYDDIFTNDGQSLIRGDFVSNFSTQLNTLSSTISQNLIDTLPLKVPISKSLIAKWMKFRSTQIKFLELTNNGTDTTLVDGQPYIDKVADSLGYDRERAKSIYRIGLFPNENSDILARLENFGENEEFVLGPGGRNPYINVGYIDDNGSSASFSLIPATTSYFASDLEPPENELSVRGLVTHQGIMELDLSMIGKASPIHRAQLELTIDRENSIIGNDGIDSVLFATVNITDSLTIGGVYGYKIDTSDVILFENFVPPIKAILTNDLNEIKLISRPFGVSTDEIRFFDKLQFYGVDVADPEKRPKLKIIYSQWSEL